jgi:hypothetical protein
MGKFIKDNIHWIVIIIGVVAVIAYTKAKQNDTKIDGDNTTETGK